jgi:hypothetical protein
MDGPSFSEFETAARREGYDEIVERVWPADQALAVHEHPFAVKALVVAGEMWLTEGETTRHLRPGDRFELAARRRTPSATAPRARPLGGAPARRAETSFAIAPALRRRRCRSTGSA